MLMTNLGEANALAGRKYSAESCHNVIPVTIYNGYIKYMVMLVSWLNGS